MIQAIGDRVRGLRRLALSFGRQSSGATAVEFGLIAAPFFFLIMAIIETAMVFWASQMLESGVEQAGRQIRTGQVQAQGMDAAGFRSLLCDRIGVLFDCDGRLAIDVRRVDNFSSVDFSRPPIDDEGNFSGPFGFNPGVGSETVTVRVFYRWPLFFNFVQLTEADFQGNQRLLAATTAFRNEPFQ